MPRPSLKEERRAEILDAYGRCIARHGVEGATLEMTAEEAGLARALIRHNVGNKDDLLDAFVERFLGDASGAAETLFNALPGKNRVTSLLDWLFDPNYMDLHEVNLTNALVRAAIGRPALAERLLHWTAGFVGMIGRVLKEECPGADDDTIEAVANGIAAIYFNVATMTPLGGNRMRPYSEAAARLLVSTLESQRGQRD